MSIKIGTADVTDIKIGTTNVNHVYVGSTLVWQRGATITYELSLSLSYSSGTYILASGSGTATLTVKLITYINGVYDSEQYVDADSGYPDISNEPTGCNFYVTRTSLGTYTISADSRGTVVNAGTDATITVKHTPSGSSQLTETETVSQEANAVVDTLYDEDVVFTINSSYTTSYSPADAAGVSWTVTASATQYDYEKYEYTSGDYSDWIQIGGGTSISAASIAIGTSGTGLSGSGDGTGTTVTWGSRGTVIGSVRAGYVEAEYDIYSDTVAVYQEANALEYTDNKVITSVLLDGVNNNITIPYTSDSITVSGSGTCTEHYTSGSSASGTFTIGASGFSVSGTGFSYSNYVVSVTENSGSERQGTVTAAYSGATSVQRTITQEEYVEVVAPTVTLGSSSATQDTATLVGNITNNGGGTITACGFQWGYTSGYGYAKVASVVQSGEFSADVTSLDPQETIYFRAYATNSAGTGYSAGGSITTEGLLTGELTDAMFLLDYSRAAVYYEFINNTFSQVNLGVITISIRQGSTSGTVVGSATLNSGNNIVIDSEDDYTGQVNIHTSASDSYSYYAVTNDITGDVLGILSISVSPPPL